MAPTLMASTPNAVNHLAFYGGTFDPPHIGHRLCVATILNIFDNLTIFVSPTPSPPIASGQLKLVQGSYQHRFAMCELNFVGLGPRVVVSSLEDDLPSPHYTVDTLRHLAQKNPRPLCLLMGQDQLQAFATWKEPQIITSMAHIIIICRSSSSRLSRSGSSVGDDSNVDMPESKVEELVVKIFSQLGLDQYPRETLGKNKVTAPDISITNKIPIIQSPHYTLVNIPVSPASSSEIRADIADGPKTKSYEWLTTEVNSYIARHNLYRGQKKA